MTGGQTTSLMVHVRDRGLAHETVAGLDSAIDKAQANLLRIQYPDGYWWASSSQTRQWKPSSCC